MLIQQSGAINIDISLQEETVTIINLSTCLQDMPFNFVHKIHSNVVTSVSFRQKQGNS
jgi:hypothetical protein